MRRLKEVLQRSRVLLFVPLVVVVLSLLLLGINVQSATAKPTHKNPNNANTSHEYYKIRDSKVDPNMSPKHRSRAQRDAAIKKRQDAKNYIQGVIEGVQPAAGKGGSPK